MNNLLLIDKLNRERVKTSLTQVRATLDVSHSQVFEITDMAPILLPMIHKATQVSGALPPYPFDFFEWEVLSGPYVEMFALGPKDKIGSIVSANNSPEEKQLCLEGVKLLASVLEQRGTKSPLYPKVHAALSPLVQDPKITFLSNYVVGDFSAPKIPVAGIGWTLLALDENGDPCSKVFTVPDLRGEFLTEMIRYTERIIKTEQEFVKADVVDTIGNFITELNRWLNMTTYYVSLAIMFLNCRNVVEVENKRPPLDRHARRRGDIPYVVYKTLAVKPISKRYASKDEGQPQEKVMPLHLVRGHFKTFTEEKPLLGKIVGRFWWPSHARGSAEIGLVHKDYQLKGN